MFLLKPPEEPWENPTGDILDEGVRISYLGEILCFRKGGVQVTDVRNQENKTGAEHDIRELLGDGHSGI